MLCSACMSFSEFNIFIKFPIALPGIISTFFFSFFCSNDYLNITTSQHIVVPSELNELHIRGTIREI